MAIVALLRPDSVQRAANGLHGELLAHRGPGPSAAVVPYESAVRIVKVRHGQRGHSARSTRWHGRGRPALEFERDNVLSAAASFNCCMALCDTRYSGPTGSEGALIADSASGVKQPASDRQAEADDAVTGSASNTYSSSAPSPASPARKRRGSLPAPKTLCRATECRCGWPTSPLPHPYITSGQNIERERQRTGFKQPLNPDRCDDAFYRDFAGPGRRESLRIDQTIGAPDLSLLGTWQAIRPRLPEQGWCAQVVADLHTHPNSAVRPGNRFNALKSILFWYYCHLQPGTSTDAQPKHATFTRVGRTADRDMVYTVGTYRYTGQSQADADRSRKTNNYSESKHRQPGRRVH